VKMCVSTCTGPSKRGPVHDVAVTSPDSTATDQRRRIIAASVAEFTHRGYDRTTVELVIQRAGVSRRTFYDVFRSKDDVFCTVHRMALELLAERVGVACESERDWPQKVAAGLAAALDWLAKEPGFSRLIVGGPFTAGPRAAYCHDLLVAHFAPGLRPGRDAASIELPPALEEMLLAGIAGLLALRLEGGELSSVTSLLPELIELVLTPYIGAEEAVGIATG
jgi:AcrR family transcriptional regulator